ncbi:MAG: (deoxy)nucleoside triphosphate pyrophosphohydrolase [Clostridia bacterium]|nr:(deoxy)nucleoside triphosphate pyrophosphohydrolase [Clostridia bacterium]MBQ5956324.1 (deoxy)nucleoside triphosphate pyrophosphohydrolase [Clostridia bacterium]
MRTVNVAAAVMIRDGKIFVTERGYGDYKDWWEFPGGKIEENESPRDAVSREIWEELGVSIEVGDRIYVIEYDYPDFHLHMEAFACTLSGGEIELREHENALWLDRDSIDSVRWLPADEEMIGYLRDNWDDIVLGQ